MRVASSHKVLRPEPGRLAGLAPLWLRGPLSTRQQAVELGVVMGHGGPAPTCSATESVDMPRSAGPRTVAGEPVATVVTRSLCAPRNGTQLSARAMAKEMGRSQSTVSRSRQAFGPQPHRSETSSSRDGLVLPALKQALPNAGYSAAGSPHDFVPAGTTTLFAAWEKDIAAGSRQGTAAPAQRARGRGATVPARPGGRWERKTFVGLLARPRRWRPSHGRGGSLPRPCRTECSAPGVPRSVSP